MATKKPQNDPLTLAYCPKSDFNSSVMEPLSRNRIFTKRFIKSSIASSDWLSKLIEEAHDGTEFSDSDRIHIFNSDDSRVALSTQDSLSLVEALLGIPERGKV